MAEYRAGSSSTSRRTSSEMKRRSIIEKSRDSTPYLLRSRKIDSDQSQCESAKKLKRKRVVERGVCGEVSVPVKTPAKTGNMQKNCRPSVVKQREFQIPPRGLSDIPTSVVIKTNPLYPKSPPPRCRERRSAAKYAPTIQEQSRYIQKTKEREMVSAIMELVNYGENCYGKKKKSRSFFARAKSLKSPFRRKGSQLRSPLRSKNYAEGINEFYP